MLFVNKLNSSSYLTNFIISLISLLEIIDVVVPDPNIVLWIAVFVADAAAVNFKGIETLLANGFSTFPIKDNPVFSNSPESLPKNPPDCPIYAIKFLIILY